MTRNRIIRTKALLVCGAILFNGCATLPHSGDSAKIPSWGEIYKETPNIIDITDRPDYAAIRQNLDALRQALHPKPPQGSFSPKARTLYDLFVKDLSNLKQRRQILGSRLKLTIPAHTQVKMPIRWFCLNLERHIADEHEYVYWIKGDPGIPYYSQLLLYADAHRDTSIQGLLWNLQRKVPFHSYPSDYQRILLEIDPNAAYKLSYSDFTHSLIEKAKLMAIDSSVGQTVSQAASPYHDYSEELKNLLNSHSSLPIPHLGEPQVINADPLFATSLYSGFSMVTTFYNAASVPFHLDLSQFYLNPARADVQRQALLPPQPSEDDIALQLEMEQTEQEVKPYITLITEPGPGNTVDTVPLQDGNKPYVTPVTEQETPAQGDLVPPQKPPEPYVTPIDDVQGNTSDQSSSDQNGTVKPSTAGNMQKQVERGQAPKSIERVDHARVAYEKDQVHFKDGNALNNDGTWKHGDRSLTNAEKKWLVKNGWTLPK